MALAVLMLFLTNKTNLPIDRPRRVEWARDKLKRWVYLEHGRDEEE
jgi:hypothetical protein